MTARVQVGDVVRMDPDPAQRRRGTVTKVENVVDANNHPREHVYVDWSQPQWTS